MPDGKSMAKATRDVGSTTRIFSASKGTATTRPFTEQLIQNFCFLSALMPDGKSMAKASRDVGSTTRIFSAQLGTATTRPFTEQLDTNFNSLSALMPDGKSMAKASRDAFRPMAHQGSQWNPFSAASIVLPFRGSKAVRNQFTGHPHIMLNMPAWWRL